MKNTLPTKRNIRNRIVFTYGIYFLIIFVIWSYIRIPFIYLLPLYAVLCSVAYYIYRINLKILTKPPHVSSDDFSSFRGVAQTDIEKEGIVKIRGELWKSTSKEKIKKGEEVVVMDVLEKMVLLVKKKE
ncbi:MAG: NfeD family protein [Candidatus Methanofastidiosia archaeon]